MLLILTQVEHACRPELQHTWGLSSNRSSKPRLHVRTTPASGHFLSFLGGEWDLCRHSVPLPSPSRNSGGGGGEGRTPERSREGEVACPFIVLLLGTVKVLNSSEDQRLGSVWATHPAGLTDSEMTIGSMENVEIFTSEGKGRGLKATKEFWAADVVFAERAYSAVVFDR